MAETTKPLSPLDISKLTPPMNITVVTDGVGLEKLGKFFKRISADDPTFGLDTETNVTADFWNRRVRLIQAGDKHEQFVIDLLAFAGSEEKLFDSQGNYGKNSELYKPVFDVLTPAVCSNAFLKTGANLPFEYGVFNWSFGQRIWNLFSVDLAERVIWAGAHSLKDYPFFSLASIVERYFGWTIDKTHQQSFDLKSPLTEEQIMYAALDTRLPLAVRMAQMKVLHKDQLLATTTIENDALGSYTDMHLTGQSLNSERWVKRLEKTVERRQCELKILDESFLPVVGRKSARINYKELERLEKIWKEGFEAASPAELAKAAEVRLERDLPKKAVLRAELNALEKSRKQLKAAARTNYSILSKQRTADLKVIEKCEGDAFLNFASGPQLVAALNKIKGIRVEDSKDETLLKYNDRPFIQALRSYKKGKKDTGTYGLQWTQRWTTKPCKEEGWLHPGDGRLHCVFNQLEAETGRSSSSKPNAQNLPKDDDVRACFVARPADSEEPDGYSIVTVDLEGAELRIIAELANAKSWIQAFNKHQDVHSVGTEILYPVEWPKLALPNCTYYEIGEDGQPKRKKCKCPGHIKLRDNNKATNFLLAYGGGPSALADALGVSTDEAKDLMRLHESKFPDIWSYLKKSGIRAKELKEARDMFGRRRLFPPPTWESSKEWFMDEHEEDLELPEEDCKAQIFAFKSEHFREPDGGEEYKLTHRPPTPQEIKWAMRGMMASIERRGKNHCIQASNASLIKRVMGCGFDVSGRPYLWHVLPQYKAKLLSMIHDELVIECPTRLAQQVVEEVKSAFLRAGKEVMKQVEMTSSANISDRWMK